MTQTKAIFIAVNYGTTQHALKFARCFPEQRIRSGEVALVMVDNTQGGDRYMLKTAIDATMPYVNCLLPSKNLGYFGGARYGLEYAKRTFGEPDWTAVSNVDLVFSVGEALDSLYKLDADNVGLVAPGIFSERTGVALNPFMRTRPHAIKMHAYRWLFSSYISYAAFTIMSRWRSGFRAEKFWDSKREHLTPCSAEPLAEIYAPHGACVFCSRGFFQRGGNWDHEPFLYGEEITLAEQARALGLPVVYEPSISMVHEHQASTGRLPARSMHRFVFDAAKYSAEKYFQLESNYFRSQSPGSE